LHSRRGMCSTTRSHMTSCNSSISNKCLLLLPVLPCSLSVLQPVTSSLPTYAQMTASIAVQAHMQTGHSCTNDALVVPTAQPVPATHCQAASCNTLVSAHKVLRPSHVLYNGVPLPRPRPLLRTRPIHDSRLQAPTPNSNPRAHVPH
jgi:hypothetical protein